MPKAFPSYKVQPVSALVPYANNARTHSEEQIAQLVASVERFGFTNPCLVDERGQLIAGHGRLLAAQRLGLREVPTIEVAGLSSEERRALILADNQLALNAGWNLDTLRAELLDLQALDFDLEVIGFSEQELAALFSEEGSGDGGDSSGLSAAYSRKIQPPIYVPTQPEPPALDDCVDRSRTDALQRELRELYEADELEEGLYNFLHDAAERHTVFRFDRIAEFYAHAPAAVQKLMEASALVVIDYDQAIERGYVELTKAMMYEAGESEGNAHG